MENKKKNTYSSGKGAGEQENTRQSPHSDRPKPWGLTPKEGEDDDNPAM
ncbi:MAG: hypothetical protein GX424_03145 [Clostridiales bacterium]|nr:hypothetical protein [Clostridiales bacterium]